MGCNLEASTEAHPQALRPVRINKLSWNQQVAVAVLHSQPTFTVTEWRWQCFQARLRETRSVGLFLGGPGCYASGVRGSPGAAQQNWPHKDCKHLQAHVVDTFGKEAGRTVVYCSTRSVEPGSAWSSTRPGQHESSNILCPSYRHPSRKRLRQLQQSMSGRVPKSPSNVRERRCQICKISCISTAQPSSNTESVGPIQEPPGRRAAGSAQSFCEGARGQDQGSRGRPGF